MFSTIISLHSKIQFQGEVSLCISSHPQVFLRKGVLKICSKFTGEHPCRSAISIKLESNFIEIALHHGCSLGVFFARSLDVHNTFGWLLLFKVVCSFLDLRIIIKPNSFSKQCQTKHNEILISFKKCTKGELRLIAGSQFPLI